MRNLSKVVDQLKAHEESLTPKFALNRIYMPGGRGQYGLVPDLVSAQVNQVWVQNNPMFTSAVLYNLAGFTVEKPRKFLPGRETEEIEFPDETYYLLLDWYKGTDTWESCRVFWTQDQQGNLVEDAQARRYSVYRRTIAQGAQHSHIFAVNTPLDTEEIFQALLRNN